MGLRLTLAVLGASAVMACAVSAPPHAPSPTAPDGDPGPPPAIPTTNGATLRLNGNGVSPKQGRVYQGSRVTFVNQDSVGQEIQSDPLHIHTDCPALNCVGLVVPGQSRASDAF